MGSRVGTDKRKLVNLLDKNVFFILFSKSFSPNDGRKNTKKPFEQKALHEQWDLAIYDIECGQSLRVPMDIELIQGKHKCQREQYLPRRPGLVINSKGYEIQQRNKIEYRSLKPIHHLFHLSGHLNRLLMLQIHRSDIVQVIIVYRLFHNLSCGLDPGKVFLIASAVWMVTFQ